MSEEQNQLTYPIADIRKLIINSFGDNEFNAFCFDYFRPVFDDFTDGQALSKRALLLLEYCDRRMLIPELLAKIKEHNPNQYRQFVNKTSHDAIGVKIEDIPKVDMPFQSVQREFRQNQKLIPTITATQIEDFEDFQFQNRERLRDEILTIDANHIELYGPSGAGKTYLLQHLNQDKQDTFAIYMDLAQGLTVNKILETVMKQLNHEAGSPTTNMAVAIQNLHKGPKNFRQFLFLFDSATEEHREIINWLLSEEGLINHRQLLDSLNALDVRHGDIKLQAVIATRRPNVKIESYHPNLRFERMVIDRLKPHPSPEKDPIQNMLRELASHKGFPIAQGACSQLSREVYYLTGGHPKCAKLLLLAVADAGFIPTDEQWTMFFATRVLPIIKQEMLSNIPDIEMLPVFWVLSVFRRFDSHLLGTLLEAGLLPNGSSKLEFSRSVRQLRKQLVDTYLVSKPVKDERLYMIDFTLRRALSINMQHQSPDRYRALNSAAINIFSDWLNNPRITPGRAIPSLMELLYHWLKALETDPAVYSTMICQRLREALLRYLPLLLPIFDRFDQTLRPDYLDLFRDHWDQDDEFQELLQRATGNADCHRNLTRDVYQFIEDHMDDD